MRRGYNYKQRLLRAAHVVVAKKKEENGAGEVKQDEKAAEE